MNIYEAKKMKELSDDELLEQSSKDMAGIIKTFKYNTDGINPKMATAVNAHVKKYGDHQIWNYFGSPNSGDADWFDFKAGRVKNLKLRWVVAK